jgi:hypothetical protein
LYEWLCTKRAKHISISELKEKTLQVSKELEIEHFKTQLVGLINLKRCTTFFLKLIVVKVNQLI